MARKKPTRAPKPAKPTRAPKPVKEELKVENNRPSNAERSAYFARREAAKVLQTMLRGDARRRAAGSLKSLVYSPSVRNKKATFALVCQTLKHLSMLKDIVDGLEGGARWKRQKELMYIIIYDILFGQDVPLMGDIEKYLVRRKDELQVALARAMKQKGLKSVEDLKSLDVKKPRYVRVNTLKISTESARQELSAQYEVQLDDMVPDLLILPPGTDLHDHHLVKNRDVFLQGKASSMAAVALGPKTGWEVIDACAAPGNKTLHIAALMKGKGKILACELNKERFLLMKDNVKLGGARNVKTRHEDFLNIDPEDPKYSKVRAILLDPSCSGSGTVRERLDHLLPSHKADHVDVNRLNKLAGFQKKILEHAFSFPAAERIVYSTCSIHQIENEDVIQSVLDIASSKGFQLSKALPKWPRRGLPTFGGSECLLRTDMVEDQEGFFIALFVKEGADELSDHEEAEENGKVGKQAKNRGTRKPLNVFVAKMLKIWPRV